MFKNETHNHPTEIEPFGGAATCIGGAIRDPLSGRSYVYQAMRVTGAADPRVPVAETLPGKLPQRKLVTTAAAGYSCYGNQIGLATGQVDELYHPGYVAKRMEIGAVVGAAPADQRASRAPGARRRGRSCWAAAPAVTACGGATGSSKSHNVAVPGAPAAPRCRRATPPRSASSSACSATPRSRRLIKRCNDFGAGGVSVAIGELADGLRHRPERGAQEVRGPGRHRAGHLRVPGAHGRGRRPGGRGRVHRRYAARGEPRGHRRGRGHREPAPGHALERRDHRRPQPRVPGHQRRGQAHRRRTWPGGRAYARPMRQARPLAEKPPRSLVHRPERLPPARACPSGSTPPSARPRCSCPSAASTSCTPAQAMAAKLPVLSGETTDLLRAWPGASTPTSSRPTPSPGAYLAVVESVAKLVAAGCERRGRAT